MLRDGLDPGFAALVNALVTEESERRRDETCLITLKSGATLLVDPRDQFGSMIAYGWIGESGDLNVFCRLARLGARVVDVGANFGLYSILTGRRVGPRGLVVAFEPVPRVFELLLQNIDLNGLGQIVVPNSCCAAGSRGKREFFVAKSASFSGLLNSGRSPITEVIRVSTIPLDEIELLADRPIDQMKIDVEGAELEVLAGAAHLIECSPDIVIQFEATHKNLKADAERDLTEYLISLAANGFVMRRASQTKNLAGCFIRPKR